MLFKALSILMFSVTACHINHQLREKATDQKISQQLGRINTPKTQHLINGRTRT